MILILASTAFEDNLATFVGILDPSGETSWLFGEADGLPLSKKKKKWNYERKPQPVQEKASFRYGDRDRAAQLGTK